MKRLNMTMMLLFVALAAGGAVAVERYTPIVKAARPVAEEAVPLRPPVALASVNMNLDDRAAPMPPQSLDDFLAPEGEPDRSYPPAGMPGCGSADLTWGGCCHSNSPGGCGAACDCASACRPRPLLAFFDGLARLLAPKSRACGCAESACVQSCEPTCGCDAPVTCGAPPCDDASWPLQEAPYPPVAAPEPAPFPPTTESARRSKPNLQAAQVGSGSLPAR